MLYPCVKKLLTLNRRAITFRFSSAVVSETVLTNKCYAHFYSTITFRQRRPKPEIRLMPQFKNRNDIFKQKEDAYRKKVLDVIGSTDKYISANQWKSIRKEVLSQNLCKSESVVNGLLLQTCVKSDFVQTSKSLYHFVKSSDQCTVTILSLLLELSGKHFNQLGENFIFDIYDELEKCSSIFCSATASNVISALSHTSRWRESLKCLDMIKVTNKVSIEVYKDIILAAFIAQESEIGWKLMNEMQENYRGFVPTKILHTWLETCNSESNEEKATSLVEIMFEFFQQYQVYPYNDIIEKIKKIFERKKHEKWIGEFTKIPISAGGKCPVCHTHLERLTLSTEEFNTLQSKFVEFFFMGDNVFINSFPEEAQQFKKIMSKMGPFDIVIDGLNVLYPNMNDDDDDQSQRRITPEPKRLFSVVSYLTKDLGQKVLVLAKNHLRRGNDGFINTLRKMAACFFTSNVSADDPFVLYAALSSGPNCKFLSRDLMRNHASKLDNNTKNLFERWKRTHQLTLLEVINNKVEIQQPDLYNTALHKSSTSWHIPYDNGSPRFDYQLPVDWLCLHKKV